jgi:phenylpyruvate tautomerase PptA (4-oxalocrotonate tautomerase family)
MPMLDLFIPTGALQPDAERKLVDELTTILLEAEGADPNNAFVRGIAWAFIHRTEMFVAGAPADKPHYRVVATVPQGNLNGVERRNRLVSEVTNAVLRAEGASTDHDRRRVWVFPVEMPDGHWGGGGSIVALESLMTMIAGDPEKGRALAQRRLAESRQEKEAVGT